ncbi:MAG TPA: prepilin-type cleavage/methylation domain-containing protein, partial [Ruminococcus sp.]|nr:prepilin-type cleavage/methylation domain-containing protein [Ruminococcus sp.]
MKKLKGFTLVEIIVVMLILAILMGMFIPNMLGY